ncbi:MAG: energy transducer TonB [Deltaproteobacteria bacterium]|nr:energy transducer TonB [Deltaproteobacteria bacterium]
MNSAARMTSSYELDDPRRRLAWVIPVSLILWAALLTLFAVLLERTAPSPPELAPAEVRLVELPPAAGLQGGAAVQHPAAAPPETKVETPKPKPLIKIRRVTVPHVRVHPAKPKVPPAPLLPPSESGTAKESGEVRASTGPPSANTGAGNAGAGRGAGSGAGIGSDSGGARAIYAPKPIIPDSLREEAFETVAVARFKVTYDGQVQVTLVTPTESPQLNQLLLETLKQWRFFPAMKSGVAIDSQFDLRIPISVE